VIENLNSLVTGGACGIGRTIVEKLLARRDKLFVFDCLPTDSEQAKELQKIGVKYFQVDVCSVDSIKNGFTELFKFLNSQNQNLSLLVNNAGVVADNLAIRMTEREWDFVLDVNLKGSFFCSQQAIKHMMKNKKGYIVNISSIVAKVGNPGQANYAASKAGIIALTKTLAQEYAARNILINAIAPGFIKTGMTEKLPENIKEKALQHIGLKRFGQAIDVANLVNFLSAGNADYITGQVFDVNGGMF